MSIKELKEKIANAPDNMQVFIQQVNTEYEYSLAEGAEIEELTFADGKLKAKDSVFVISDEI